MYLPNVCPFVNEQLNEQLRVMMYDIIYISYIMFANVAYVHQKLLEVVFPEQSVIAFLSMIYRCKLVSMMQGDYQIIM